MDSTWYDELISVAAYLISFISLILYYIFFSCIITLQDFYSCFRRVFNLLSYILLESWKSSCHLSSKNNVAHDGVITTSNPMILTTEDVEIVMEKLGLIKDHRPQEPLVLQDSFENIVNMFDNAEPSLDEVREAFRLFDDNNDDFIDSKELKKVMSSLGLVGLSEEECQRMIMAFDDDGDGMISFGEFVKLIEENVVC